MMRMPTGEKAIAPQKMCARSCGRGSRAGCEKTISAKGCRRHACRYRSYRHNRFSCGANPFNLPSWGWRGWNAPNPHNRSEIESHRNGRRRVMLYYNPNRLPVAVAQPLNTRVPLALKTSIVAGYVRGLAVSRWTLAVTTALPAKAPFSSYWNDTVRNE